MDSSIDPNPPFPPFFQALDCGWVLRLALVLVPMDPMEASLHHCKGNGYNKGRSIHLSCNRLVLQFTFPASTTPYVYFPTGQSGANAFNVSHDSQRHYELHDHSVHSRPISNHLSESRLHLPPQSSQIHFPSSNGKISRDSQATSNSGEKCMWLPSDQDTSSQKRT